MSLFKLSHLHAIVSLGDNVELEGTLKFQNILRTPKFKDAEAIMQRNTAQLESKYYCLLYTSPSPRDLSTSRMPSSA